MSVTVEEILVRMINQGLEINMEILRTLKKIEKNPSSVDPNALWREQNPELAKICSGAADKLSKYQKSMIFELCESVDELLGENEYARDERLEDLARRAQHVGFLVNFLSSLGGSFDAVQ